MSKTSKTKIEVNGKNLTGDEAKELLGAILKAFVGDDDSNIDEVVADNKPNMTPDEKAKQDLPKGYDNIVDYLALEDFDITKTISREQYDDLCVKLNNRLDFIKAHPNISYKDTLEKLEALNHLCKEFRSRFMSTIGCLMYIIEYITIVQTQTEKNENQG